MKICTEPDGVNPPKSTCSSCSIRDLCISAEVNRDDLYKLDDWVETRGVLHKGDHVFRQGDIFSAIYAVRVGYIKTYLEDEEGLRRIVGFYMTGEIFGLESIHAEHNQCSAEVLDTALVCRLPFYELSRICSHVPGLQGQLLRLMSQELVTAARLSAKQSVQSKLAAFLIGWGERLAQRGYSSRQFTLPMNRQDIAGYLNVAPETVTRWLGHFIEKGWIKSSNREMTLVDKQALIDHCWDWRL